MFIPEFWCGVGACILAEIITFVIAITVSFVKWNNRKER